MKDSSREVYVTYDGVPLNIKIVANGDVGYYTETVVVDDSAYDIYPLLSEGDSLSLYEKIEDALREESLQQEMDIAEDKALWRDM